MLGSAEVIRHTTPAGHVFHYFRMPETDRTAIVVDWKSAWVHGAEHPTTAHIGAILMTISGTGGSLQELVDDRNAAGAHAELNATADGARGLLAARNGHLEEVTALLGAGCVSLVASRSNRYLARLQLQPPARTVSHGRLRLCAPWAEVRKFAAVGPPLGRPTEPALLLHSGWSI